jgi:hypothetical protein
VIFIICFFSGLSACRKETQNVILPNPFERKWYSINGHLQIDSTNTFEYIRYACMSQTISKGTWKIVNDTLILNSFAPKGCYFIEDFKIEPPKDTLNMIPNVKTEKDCEANTGYVIFKNEKFYIKDTLLMSKKSAYFEDGELNYHTNFKRTSYYPR